jgi:phospholipid transport system substrate-binding protein
MRISSLKFMATFCLVAGLAPSFSYAKSAAPTNNSSVASSQKDFSKEASDLILHLHDRVAKELAGQQISTAERQTRFRVMLQEAFDIDRISRFVLGNYYRVADDTQKQTFRKYFEDLLVQTYAESFKSYSGNSFKIQNVRMVPETGMALVSTSVNIPKKGNTSETAPLSIEWRIKPDQNGYKIVDVSIENVSMSITKRQEFGSIIQSGGGQVSALIQKLEQQTKGVRQS